MGTVRCPTFSPSSPPELDLVSEPASAPRATIERARLGDAQRLDGQRRIDLAIYSDHERHTPYDPVTVHGHGQNTEAAGRLLQHRQIAGHGRIVRKVICRIGAGERETELARRQRCRNLRQTRSKTEYDRKPTHRFGEGFIVIRQFEESAFQRVKLRILRPRADD